MPHSNGEDYEMHEDRNVMVYFVSGIAVGLLIGSAASLLLAPKPGSEMRHDLAEKYGEVKGKVSQWMEERKHQTKTAAERVAEEINA